MPVVGFAKLIFMAFSNGAVEGKGQTQVPVWDYPIWYTQTKGFSFLGSRNGTLLQVSAFFALGGVAREHLAGML